MKLIIVTILAALLVGVLATGNVPREDCPSPYVLIGYVCYWFPDDKLSWDDALKHCEDNEPIDHLAGLAHIDDCLELGLVWHYIEETEILPIEDYWIGGSDKDSEGEFRWHYTGTNVQIEVPFWFPGQPDGGGTENALSLSKTGYFADEKADIEQRFICQLL